MVVQAVEIVEDRLVLREVNLPALSNDDVRIDIKATAINRADLAQRAGSYDPPAGATRTMGLECAGIVAAIGDNVTQFKTGDPVCALLAGGGYAESVVVPSGQVLPIPEGLDFTQAAAIPEVFATAYLNIFMEAAAQPNEHVLLHAGASGVGTTGIQMCRAFGNPSYVTAGNDTKIQTCIDLGASAGCNRHSNSFADHVKEWTEERGVDVILDPVGGHYLNDNIRSLNVDGRLVIIGLMGGASAEIPLGIMMVKRLRVIGSTLRARSVPAKTEVMQALHQRVWPLLESGEIKPIIEEIIPLADVEKAHQHLASNDTIGKIVLKVAA